MVDTGSAASGSGGDKAVGSSKRTPLLITLPKSATPARGASFAAMSASELLAAAAAVGQDEEGETDANLVDGDP